MECSIQQLVSAFQAGTSSDSCSIRLTKKAGIPYLTFTAETAGQVAIVQDVPCRIMTVDEAHRFREPDLPLPEVRLGIHDFKTMKSVVDRMQTIGKLLTVEADMGGNLTLSVATELVAAKSYFRDLKAHAGTRVGPQAAVHHSPPPCPQATTRRQAQAWLRVWTFASSPRPSHAARISGPSRCCVRGLWVLIHACAHPSACVALRLQVSLEAAP